MNASADGARPSNRYSSYAAVSFPIYIALCCILPIYAQQHHIYTYIIALGGMKMLSANRNSKNV